MIIPYLVSSDPDDDHARCDIVEMDEDDVLQVYGTGGTKFSNTNFMGCLLRPRLFITPGTTM